jgi:hypothetical protein
MSLRSKPIEVRVTLSNIVVDWSKFPKLSPEKPDDCLVAEAATLGPDTKLLTSDTGPLVRAILAGIDAFEPKQDWLLPVEQSDDQRELERTKRELERLSAQFPAIIASLPSSDASVPIALSVPLLLPLDGAMRLHLESGYLRERPRANVSPPNNPFIIRGLRPFEGHRQHTAERYHAEYSDFVANVSQYFAKLDEQMERRVCAATVEFVIHNNSVVTANGLRIDANVDGEFDLFADEQEAMKFVRFSSPPEAPKVPLPEPRSAMLDLLNLSRPNDRQSLDPTKFEFLDGSNSMLRSWSIQCGEFRPTSKWKKNIWLGLRKKTSGKGVLHMRISASNLPDPIEIERQIEVKAERMEWNDSRVLTLLPEPIRSLLTQI